jgi:hypothetical protein
MMHSNDLEIQVSDWSFAHRMTPLILQPKRTKIAERSPNSPAQTTGINLPPQSDHLVAKPLSANKKAILRRLVDRSTDSTN